MKLVALAAFSALMVCVGVALVFVPAGLIVAGVFGLAALYVTAYLEARRDATARRPG